MIDDLLLYAATINAVATPIISPSGGDVASGTQVTITCATSGATIYYTTDGSDPDATDTEYTGPITINTGMTIKAIAIKDGLTDSAVASETYTISTVIQQPIIFMDI